MKKLTQTEVIQKFKKTHGSKYNYQKVKYLNAHTKVYIICPDHGEFLQEPNSHWNGCGCPKCKSNKLSETFISNQKEFIDKASKIHPKMIYSQVKYTNSKTKVCIICPDHGEFWQRPANHLSGQGCPYCKKSKGELQIEKWLNENFIHFIPQKRFSKCRNIYELSFDFFLPQFNICIEYDGLQHFKPTGFGGNPIEKLQRTQINDKIKTKFCKENKIQLIRITYKQFKHINEILKSQLL